MRLPSHEVSGPEVRESEDDMAKEVEVKPSSDGSSDTHRSRHLPIEHLAR